MEIWISAYLIGALAFAAFIQEPPHPDFEEMRLTMPELLGVSALWPLVFAGAIIMALWEMLRG